MSEIEIGGGVTLIWLARYRLSGKAEVTFIGSVIYNTEEVNVNNSHGGIDVDSFPVSQMRLIT